MNNKRVFGVGSLIFLSFLLISAEYITWWLHALVPNFNSTAADLLSEGVGYLFQVIGMLLVALLIKKQSTLLSFPFSFGLVILFDYLASILACTFSSKAFILGFGFSMNFFHGVITGWYLFLLTKMVSRKLIGVTFGLSYALASLAFYFLNQVASLLHPANIIFAIYFVLAVLVVLVYESVKRSLPEPITEEEPASGPAVSTKIIVVAFVLIVLVSLSRGLGFYFPSSDSLLNGVDPVFTRCFYAVGLILAGIVNDLSRRYGGILCLLSLVFPFIVLALYKQPDTETLFWIIGYIFFGFLAVYQVTLAQDISKHSSQLLWISVMGLALGRVGDVLGVFIGVYCSGQLFLLLGITIALFTLCVLIFFYFYNQYYLPVKIIQKEVIIQKDSSSTMHLAHQIAEELQLSEREAEVLDLLLNKKSNNEIAYDLCISENTVKFHVKNILKKAECQNRKQLFTKYAPDGPLGTGLAAQNRR